MMRWRHPEGCMTLTLLVVACTCLLPTRGQTNNSVSDADGSIIWGEVAPDKPYKTVDYTADDGGLDPYYDLAVSFIDSSLPEKLPVAMVKDIMDGKASIGDSWKELAKLFLGYALCLAIGFLFIIIFPIVGCCFCCCRCCGNCGGKRIQHQGPKDSCKRITFAIALSILALFVVTGAACAFVTNDQFSDNLDGLNTSFSEAVDDFNTFADNIDQQFRRLGDVNFVYLTNVLEDYVNNTSPEMSEDIITAINKAVNLDQPLANLDALRGTALTEVQQLEGQVSRLEKQKDTALTQLNALHSDCSCLTTEIDFLNNLDLSPLKADIAAFKDEISTDVFQEMKNDLDDAIKTEVEKATGSIDVVGEMDKIHDDQIKGLLDKVSDFKNNLNEEASKYQDHVEDLVEFVEPYDKYRWYAGVGLASLLALIAVMMLVGVLLGVCCGSVRDKPTERGAASNCGGICLMAAVGLVFIFGALLMLLCTLMYLFGALTERYVCQTIDNLDRVEEYAKSFDVGPDLENYTLTLNGETVSFALHSLMADCEEGKTLYTALGLKHVVDTALDKIDDFKKDHLEAISNINAGDAAADASGKVDTAGAIDKLENSVQTIDDVKKNVSSLKNEVEQQKDKAETAQSGAGVIYDPMISTLSDMEATCASLNDTAQKIKDAATDLENVQLKDAEEKLNNQTFMTQLIDTVTTDYMDTIFGFADSYVNDIRTKLAVDIGKCTPFYTIINAILGEALCHGIVDPLNGFWLALGWCLFFFMPSLILAVKLAKHFRTMLYEDSYDATVGSSPPPPYYTESSVPPKTTSLFPPINGPNNKVAPF